MAIKRYKAIKDNTITNAFDESLSNRATGSNMGQSDILEVFSIYAQATTSSSELTRALIQFNTPEISTDRTNGVIPASGSVRFYLKLYNAQHSRTLPRDFTLKVHAISGSWQEGRGLDMESYKDVTNDHTGSNWVNATGGPFTVARAEIKVADGDLATSGQFTEKEHITLISTDGTSKRYVITDTANGGVATGTLLSDSDNTDTGTGTAGSDEDGGVAVGVNLTSVTQNALLVQLKAAIEHQNGHNGKIIVSSIPAQADGVQTMGLTQSVGGRGGNSLVITDIDENKLITPIKFGFGAGRWASVGGDFYTDTSSSFEQNFTVGNEDLEVDVTELVEQWVNSSNNVLGSKENNGFIIKLSSQNEAYRVFGSSLDSGSIPHNPNGALVSYYTKKFFARGSEFFFKQPRLEARWNSALKDNRGSFYLSSSLAPEADNLNTIWLYNYIRGNLRNIPSIGTGKIYVSIHSGNAADTGPFGAPLTLSPNKRGGFEASVLSTQPTVVTGGYYATGIYTASFPYKGNSTIETIYDVWRGPGNNSTQFHTGTIKVKRFDSSNINPNGKYVVSMPNLKDRYSNKQTERFRLYVRNKNWSPSVFTKIQTTPETLIIESASYQVTRITDQRVVIPYGTRSVDNNCTMLSYDVSGNYFDLDMSMLEAGYTYGLQYSFYEDSVNSYRQLPYLFKIRVEKDEY